jgi:mevalonate kinase
MELTGEASGKLLLFGEHAAVHGHPAIGLSLPMQLRVDIVLTGSKKWQIIGIPIPDENAVIQLLSGLEKIIPGFDRSLKGTVRISSTIPIGVGFGSSAALCGALARAMSALWKKRNPHSMFDSLQTRDVWAWAHEAEKIFHGTPSGIDTGLSLHRGLYGFLPQSLGLPEIVHLNTGPLYLVAGAVPRKDGAKKLIAGIGRAVSRGDRDVLGKLSDLGHLAGRAMNLLSNERSNSFDELGRLALNGQDILASLGLSTPEIDVLLSLGLKHGAAGGKLSGAGGGGAFFLVYRDEQAALEGVEILRKAAQSSGIKTWETIHAFGTASLYRKQLPVSAADTCY